MVNTYVDIQEIHIMYKKVYVVAEELIADAITLYKKESYARAYYLAQAALGEFGKLNMIYAQALRVYNKEKITTKEMAVRLSEEYTDDTLVSGIVLLIEKDLINYPAKIDSILHQPNIRFSDDLNSFAEEILEDTTIVSLLEAYKLLKSTKVLSGNELSRELCGHVNKFRSNLMKVSYLNEEFVMPSEVVTVELCKKRLMSVITVKRIYEITGYQNKSFDLFEFEAEHYRKIEEKLI